MVYQMDGQQSCHCIHETIPSSSKTRAFKPSRMPLRKKNIYIVFINCLWFVWKPRLTRHIINFDRIEKPHRWQQMKMRRQQCWIQIRNQTAACFFSLFFFYFVINVPGIKFVCAPTLPDTKCEKNKSCWSEAPSRRYVEGGLVYIFTESNLFIQRFAMEF